MYGRKIHSYSAATLQTLTIDTLKALKDCSNKIDNGAIIFCMENERVYLKMKNKILAITPKPKLTKTNCINCGAPLKILPKDYESIIQCEYCGTVFDLED